MIDHQRWLRPSAAAAVALLLSGCATFSADGGFNAVAQTTKERSGGAETRLLRNEDDHRALEAEVRKLLKEPLSAQVATQIALLNNRGLQATYWQLGIAEADLVQAGRLKNPGFTFKRTHGGGAVAIERTLTFNLINLLTLPLASRIESQRFEQVKLQVSAEALHVAQETARAYYEALGATQALAAAKQVQDAAGASAELAARMQKAGNWSKLDAAREQAFNADALAEVRCASRQANATREKLTRLLGLSGVDARYTLPDRLPDLPPTPRELKDVEEQALRDRLDIQAAKLETGHTANSLGLNKATRFINVLDLGAVRESAANDAGAHGYELTLEIPLFDWGGAKVARSEAVYMQSVNRLTETANNARSEARESYADYRDAYELARHYQDNVLPMRQQISQETLLRYNGMLMSVFELLAEAREQSIAVRNTITALQEFWIADTNLDAALGGKTK
jgi:outer membrane protein TolC